MKWQALELHRSGAGRKLQIVETQKCRKRLLSILGDILQIYFHFFSLLLANLFPFLLPLNAFNSFYLIL